MARNTTKSPAARRAARPGKDGKEPADHARQAKAKFSKALEEARAGARELGAEARARAGAYRDKAAARSGDWVEEARAYGEQAKARAAELAAEGKTRASDALAGLGRLVADNAEVIDEKIGPRYGDYARSVSRKMQEAAARIEAKDFEELGEDAREFVRKSPGLAMGMAAVAGFILARLFTGSKK